MAVAILDAITHVSGIPASISPSAGSNREQYIAVTVADATDAAPATSGTLGGQTLEVVETVDDSAGAHDVAVTVFRLVESAIAAMSGSTLSISGQAGSQINTITWSVQGSDQTLPAKNSAALTAISGSLSLARVADSVTVAISAHDGGIAFSTFSDPSADFNALAPDSVIAYGAAVDTARPASFVWDNSQTRNNASIVLNIAPSVGAPTPTITDIDGDESVYPGQSYIIQATDDIGATAGTVFWERLDGTDSVQHTVTNWDAATDQITVTAVRGTHNYGAGLYRARVVLADTTEIVFDNGGAGLTLEAQPGTFAVTAASPNTTDDASLWTGLIDTATGEPVTVVDGDQAWVKTLIDGLAIAPDGKITANETGSFTVQFWKASEGVWGVDQTVTFTASSGGLTDLELKKKQNKRRRYTANLFGAWRNRFMGDDDE